MSERMDAVNDYGTQIRNGQKDVRTDGWIECRRQCFFCLLPKLCIRSHTHPSIQFLFFFCFFFGGRGSPLNLICTGINLVVQDSKEKNFYLTHGIIVRSVLGRVLHWLQNKIIKKTWIFVFSNTNQNIKNFDNVTLSLKIPFGQLLAAVSIFRKIK